MHINNTYLTNVNVGQSEAAQAASEAGRRPEAAASQPAEAASTHVPSPELQHLVGQVRQQPPVRHELVRNVASKLAKGHYTTRHAARQTAHAIQKSPG